MTRPVRSLMLWGALAILVAFALPARASKYIGPRSAVVRCRVERVLRPGARPPATAVLAGRRPEIRWMAEPGEHDLVAEATVLAVEAYDDNGWKSDPATYVPSHVYITLPRAVAVKGRMGRAQLQYAPGYGGKLIITHLEVQGRWIADGEP